MRNYPQYIATKQDFINLLAIPEHRKQALDDLKKILDVADDKAERTISIDEATNVAVIEIIDNPYPLYKIKGFHSREDLSDLVAAEDIKT